MGDDKRHAGYSKSKSGRAKHSGQDSFELRRDIAQYRGAAHPLCFTDEVMDHQIPEGFKPVNIESYDDTIVGSKVCLEGGVIRLLDQIKT